MNAVLPEIPHLTDELLIVRHSGEIPEVALHGSIHYLTDDPDGPGLNLTDDDFTALKSMVVERYREIIQRDLEPENRDKSFYRGVARAAVNWRRLEKFCLREKIALETFRHETGARVLAFLRRERADVRSGKRASSLNLSEGEIRKFMEELGLDPEVLG